MSIGISENKKEVVLENAYAKISISKKDAAVLSIIDKRTKESIKGENTQFIEVYDMEKNTVPVNELTLEKDVITASTPLGKVSVKVTVSDNYFTYEVTTKLPKGGYKMAFANCKFDYERKNGNLCAATIAMTINANPTNYPDGKSKYTRAECYEHLGSTKGAKVGICIVPLEMLVDVLKEMASTIDRKKGIVSKNAGPWSRDGRLAFGDYLIDSNAHPEHVKEVADFYKECGVDQVDFHQGINTFRQGDFKFWTTKDGAEFKEKVVGVLNEKGIEAGLHTYAYYINFRNNEILSNPENQKMLERTEVFTLAEDIDEKTDFIKVVEESVKDLPTYYGFFAKNLPYILIGDEIIQFTNDPAGFKNCQRGICGTTAKKHKKGEQVAHLTGFFNLFCPVPGTKLFTDVAHYTAKAFNEGGFVMIYLDALDGISRHCTEDEQWYYCALFVHEIVKNCDRDPIIEYSTMYPSIWAARARMNAWDTPYRAYKAFNMKHHRENQVFVDRHYACTLGWYNYYPTTDRYPGNQHTKYHHWDAIDHMGSLAVMYDYSSVFNGMTPDQLNRYEGLRRNVARYKQYSDLRKSHYFKESTLEKMRKSPYEFALRKTEKGKYVFDEKHYETKRLYDFMDENRNTAEFSNPFNAQTPFIRIEADMSTMGNNPLVLLPLDENKPLMGQGHVHEFGGEINLEHQLAMKVKVLGNGKKGSAIAIKTRCASNSEFGYGEYIIDTDFTGWREFVLLEADNGDRPDLPFDDPERLYRVYRSGLNCDRMVKIELETAGDMTGVQMSSVVACEQTYNVIKNPTVKYGEELVMFECELMSTDFIEFDGKSAKVVDRYGNEKPIWFTGNITLRKGKNKVRFTASSCLNNCVGNVHLTLGFTGKEVK